MRLRMDDRPNTFLLLLACVAAFGEPLQAQGLRAEFPDRQVLQLKEGPNAVDIDGNGQADLVVRGWYNNYNTHSFHFLTFYVQYPDSEGNQIRWDV